jgi:transposase
MVGKEKKQMEALYKCVCGLDVHKASVQACVRRLTCDGKIEQEVRGFGTMTRDLLALGDWLASLHVTHVAMESTGVYWKPVYYLLEGRFELLLVNARHVKHVPGRKTDVLDCQWLAQLLQCGLLRASFVPELPQRELRDLTRQRSQLVSDQVRVANRIHKVLEDANIKLSSVASDIFGVSGRDMLRALAEGKANPAQMADLARRQMRRKIPQLEQALEGRMRGHHRFLLAELLDQFDEIERRIERFSQRIVEASRPFAKAISAVAALPGFDHRAAENTIAEIGDYMGRFPTAAHLSSWAGMCPGSQESAGKRKSGKTTKGNRFLRATLTQAAWAASRTKDSYLNAQYHRLVAKRGKKRALVAVGHSLLVTIYHVLKTGACYQDLGRDYFDKRNSARLVKHHVRRLKGLGYDVALVSIEQVA